MTQFEPSSSTTTASVQPKGRYDLITLAASAGGLAALLRILGALPATLEVPIVVILHRTPQVPSVLSTILKRKTSLPVKQAERGEPLEMNRVYVAPPDYHLVLRPDRTLQFTDGARIKHVRSSANPLLESAARVLHGRVIAVVLTGSGSDATDGVQTVKGMGGVVIAQNPAEAEYPDMPAAAIRTGAVDYVVSLDEIAPLLVRLTSTSADGSPGA